MDGRGGQAGGQTGARARAAGRTDERTNESINRWGGDRHHVTYERDYHRTNHLFTKPCACAKTRLEPRRGPDSSHDLLPVSYTHLTLPTIYSV